MDLTFDNVNHLCYHYQNEVITMKKHFTKLNAQYQQPCQKVWAYRRCVHLR